MKPLCSVCAFRIWKISSCLRMPVAPATFRSLATWVSFWMLMSFRSLMLRPARAAVRRGGRGGGFGLLRDIGLRGLLTAASGTLTLVMGLGMAADLSKWWLVGM